MNMMTSIKPDFKTDVRLVCIDHVALDETFRFRRGGIEATHRADLASTLRNTGSPLDPILVWQPEIDEPENLILLDGAHRVEAYLAVEWPDSVPASVLIGVNHRTALAAALSVNAKRALGLSQADRMNAAWRLVREPVQPRFKVKEVARLADVAGRTVDKMRARHRFMHEEKIEITGIWAKDQRTLPIDDDALNQMTDARRQKEIASLAADIRDLFDRRKNPERAILRDNHAVWEAVQEALGERAMKDMLAYLLGDDDEVNEWLEFAKLEAWEQDDIPSDLPEDDNAPEPPF